VPGALGEIRKLSLSSLRGVKILKSGLLKGDGP